LVRGVERFSRFLTAAALACGQQVVFERLASDAAVPARTVREYFQVLEDTLLGSLLQPYRPRRPRRKPASHAKLYLFDVGVANVLAGTTRVEAASPAFGRALEQLVFCELRACLAYNRSPDALTFWRTTDGSEVDFVIGDDVAIEVKGTGAVIRRDLTGLRRIADETALRRRIVVCTESAARIVDGIEILPVRRFLHALWNGGVIDSHAPAPLPIHNR
jgi:predicted AAA+ superfamily ATPase